MSKLEVNTIAPQCGTTLTLGESGDTVTLGSGASQSGFGSTGGISWQTSIKTTDFTAASNEGYFVNTSGGSNITVTLPASPSAGNVVAIKDYARTFGTNKVILNRNGSNMDGEAANTNLETDGLSVILVFMDSTKGWSFINDDTTGVAGATFITATGGTITTDGNFKVHTFTGPGTFTVSSAGNPAGSDTVDYLVVAGGGGGGYCMGGGGGAGGFRESPGTTTCYTASPLGTSPATALPVSATGYPIAVGAGGGGGTSNNDKGCSGAVSTFSTISSAGGGGGGARPNSPDTTLGIAGGSGGGNANDSPTGNVNPAGNTPPVNPPQGSAGGFGRGNTGNNKSGGGGGATGAGGDGSGSDPNTVMGAGGVGATTNITGSPVAYAGGGGGGKYANPGSQGTGAASPCGTGGVGGPSAGNGTTNRGGGGGGGGHTSDPGTQNGGNGGSGIVIIRYRFQ
tara:strand:- start:39 stop:1400 length:1362 start_codon:yes stop_codon:yes gene_type:complete